uniref:Uncharacterized protein n=1 Tax=Arundo donax TaxID=35708 RepID=A0A0A9BNR6_ARUDO
MKFLVTPELHDVEPFAEPVYINTRPFNVACIICYLVTMPCVDTTPGIATKSLSSFRPATCSTKCTNRSL